MGGIYQDFTSRQHMIAPDFEVYRYRSTYLNEVALHHHDFYEVYLLLRGRVAYTVENRIYQVRPGDIMLISPLELHQARISTDAEPYERIVLWVARSYLESLSSAKTSLTRCFDTAVPGRSNRLRPSPQVSTAFRRRLEQLGALHSQQDYGSDLLDKCCRVELLVALNRAVAEAAVQPADCTCDRVVDQVVEYINEHYNEPLTLDDLSERFFISKYHLLRKFDRQVGTTVHRYILQKRLLIAKQLLGSGLAPSEVCQHCGFGDYANFYRAFRAEYHITPRQYALAQKEGQAGA